MNERRTVRRMKSFLRGLIYFDARRGASPCLVRDMNDEGARIIFSEAVTLPEIVNLHIPQKEQTLRARVSWRRGDEIGLSFAVEAADLPEASVLMERVAQLEAEILKLRRMLKRLKHGADPDNQLYDDGVAA
jgi:PilZ domain